MYAPYPTSEFCFHLVNLWHNFLACLAMVSLNMQTFLSYRHGFRTKLPRNVHEFYSLYGEKKAFNTTGECCFVLGPDIVCGGLILLVRPWNGRSRSSLQVVML